MATHPDERWLKVQGMFARAKSLDRHARERFLDQACAGDEHLRRELIALLDAHDEPDSLFDPPAPPEAETISPDAPAPGSGAPSSHPEWPTIPGHTLVREIGRGGMGVVYEAERVHPRRRVAVKLLRPTFTHPAARKRFQHEILLLARLQHPGIAQIFDAGVAPSRDGPVPYFTMELVEGRSLLGVGADSSVDTRARLSLVAAIADALHHAHLRGIVHRDLKPGNILVTRDGQPKILDFGVARALDPELHTTTLRTEVGQLIGTLPYMSPEQVAGSTPELDPRSDVYSLGVVAYELVAGRLPYDLGEKIVPEVMRVIQQQEPARLSATNRACRGDIETIIAKALEKEPARRYQSASDLAADIRRCLADEPIVARPPSRAYLVRKFAKRHRALVLGAVVAGIVLVVGASVSTALALRLAGANRTLGDALGDAGIAKLDAQRRAEAARAVNEFYTKHLLLAAAPEIALGADVTIREALASASQRVDAELASQPEAAAYIHLALASVYRRLAAPDKAIDHASRSSDLYHGTLGPDHQLTLEADLERAQILHEAARFDEAQALRERTLRSLSTHLGDAHPTTLRASISHAGAALERGDSASALGVLTRAVPALEAIEDTPPDALLDARQLLAAAYEAEGQAELAQRVLSGAIEGARPMLDPDHPALLSALNSLAATRMDLGDFQGALPIVEELVDAAERVFGPEHVNTLIGRQNLARTLAALGRMEEAEPHWLAALPGLKAALTNPHPLVGHVHQSYAIALAENQRPLEAITQLLESHRHLSATLGDAHPETQRTIGWLAGLYERLGDQPNAEAWNTRLVD